MATNAPTQSSRALTQAEMSFLEEALIQLEVLASGVFPGKIFRHSGTLQFSPGILMEIYFQRCTDRGTKRFSIRIMKDESCIPGMDSVVQSAHSPNNRNTAVTHG